MSAFGPHVGVSSWDVLPNGLKPELVQTPSTPSRGSELGPTRRGGRGKEREEVRLA